MNSAIERLVQLRVSDVMQRKVIELPASSRMTEAASKLLDHEISGAPVVDESGRCIGLLSATDFLRWAKAGRDLGDLSYRGRCHHVTQQSADAPIMVEESPDDDVRAHMTAAVQSIAADEWLTSAARRMCAAHVHRLPVVDARGRVVGVVSSLDIAAAMIGAIEE